MSTRALLISVIAHGVLACMLLVSTDWSWRSNKAITIPLEAKLIVKKAKAKKVLQQKEKTVKAPNIESKKEKLPETVDVKPSEISQPALKAKKSREDYSKMLASLSQSFAQEVVEDAKAEPTGEVVTDSTYFDQVYSLIKESFVVPPHLNGPQGERLRAVMKIYLSSDGGILKLELVTPSGDDHFDKAVTEGTRRVNNFGAVPLLLQDLVRERGIVVELCPITCGE